MSTTQADASPRRGRGRRPAGVVRAEVLTAAADLLLEGGVTAVTFERVATVAGASRTTLHKWWPTPGALAAEAYFDRVKPDLEFSDTGDIRADVRRQLVSFAHVMTETPAGKAVRELIGVAQTDARSRIAFTHSYAVPRREEAVRALQVAQDRGQIRADVPLDVLVDQLWGACYHRILLFDEDVTEELIDHLIVNALRAPES